MPVYIGICIPYYLLLLHPHIHQLYIYNIVERTIPKTSYFVRAAFHYCLYIDSIQSAFASVVALIVICILKDISFLINHAEQRLAKIEQIIYESGHNKRIVHLHCNVYSDDQLTRFHKHCFDTNRIYLDDISTTAEETSLAINNYRQVRKEKRAPRKFNSEYDRQYWLASSNKYMFISNRNTFYLLPLFTIIWCIIMADFTFDNRMIINNSLFVIDLCTFAFDNKTNDLSIGISYVIATILGLFFL